MQKLIRNIKCDKVDKLIMQDMIQVNLIMETLTLRYSRGSNQVMELLDGTLYKNLLKSNDVLI